MPDPRVAVDAGDTTPALPLCASTELADKGRAWVWDLQEFGRPVRAFVLRFEGRLVAYLNRCLHVPTEMDWNKGEFLDMDKRWLMCSIHGAVYSPTSGQCMGGPCGRGKLKAVAVAEWGGQVYWYPSQDLQPVVFD